ncbi:MAG: sel1 repeat family protein [Thermoanaerobaculia bacterium]|nr:sel1 repeat family protein [Thermoanaerobaculia bacterium]
MIRSSRISLLAFLAILAGISATAETVSDAIAAYGKQDYATALRLVRPLADKGSADAQFLLGMMYRGGEGVPPDETAGASWMLRAAEQGHRRAQFFVGSSYNMGKGVPEDPVEAAKWLLRSAEQGFAAAQLDLAAAYTTGRGVPRDYVQAYLWSYLATTQFAPGDHRIGIATFTRDNAASSMTAEQIAEAQRLASEWKPKPEKPGKK